MIVVKVELWPFGDGTKKKTIANMVIGNSGRGDAWNGHYRGYESNGQRDVLVAAPRALQAALLDEPLEYPEVWHVRRDNVWTLIGRMLKAMRYVT